MKKFFILLLGVLVLNGCSNNKDNGLISYMEAKEQIINNGAVLIDVRTEAEYTKEHISGAINIPLDSISNAISFNLDTPIIVYCQSGNRSSQALTKLKDLGYTSVYDLGAIDNWEE